MDTPKIISPFGLIQETLRHNPWQMLIACVMLNLTNIVQVRQVIFEFFKLYLTPEEALKADQESLAKLLKPLGLYNRRASTIIKLSKAYVSKWDNVRGLPGVGKYAADSWRIFVEGKLDVLPTDSKLIEYIKWARMQK